MDNIENNFFESYDSFNISLGELLRGERATLGKSYSDVQKDLKIKANYIKSIGWKKNQPCFFRVKLTKNLDNKFINTSAREISKYLSVNKWKKKSLFDLTYIRQENKGPGAARNHGLEKSRGDMKNRKAVQGGCIRWSIQNKKN